jgi:hypothetical protein
MFERAFDVMMTASQPATPTSLNSGKRSQGELVKGC